jgi:hypothetical protein
MRPFSRTVLSATCVLAVLSSMEIISAKISRKC